jgi:hypothetical protein
MTACSGRLRAENPHHRHSLLRARRERPRGCRAPEQRDERAPVHSITSSARAISVAGMSRRSAKLIAPAVFVQSKTDSLPG